MKYKIGNKKQFSLRESKVDEFFTRTVKSTGNSGKVGCPRKFVGRKAVILILPEGENRGK